MRRYFGWVGVTAAALLASTGSAEESHVKARIVADVAEIRAGESFHLGVLLEPEPGWHVYWRNPGEAGLATEIRFDLPEGFEVSELRWPVPVSFEQPGGIIGYGYEEPVVLAAQVTVPSGVGNTVSVKADASWLACKDVCILGSAELVAELPLGDGESASSRAALESWVGSLPADAPPGPVDLSVTGGPVPQSGAVDLAVWLSWRETPGVVEFFPDPGPGLKVEGVRVQTRGLLTRIDLTVSRLKTSSEPETVLRSLVVRSDAKSDRSAAVALIEIE